MTRNTNLRLDSSSRGTSPNGLVPHQTIHLGIQFAILYGNTELGVVPSRREHRKAVQHQSSAFSAPVVRTSSDCRSLTVACCCATQCGAGQVQVRTVLCNTRGVKPILQTRHCAPLQTHTRAQAYCRSTGARQGCLRQTRRRRRCRCTSPVQRLRGTRSRVCLCVRHRRALRLRQQDTARVTMFSICARSCASVALLRVRVCVCVCAGAGACACACTCARRRRRCRLSSRGSSCGLEVGGDTKVTARRP